MRGTQLHLLREHDSSAVAERFLQQIEQLQRPFISADAAAGVAGPSDSNGNNSSSSSTNGTSNDSSSNDGSNSGGGCGNPKSSSVGSKEYLRRHPSTVRFRLIEGGVSSLLLGTGAGAGCGSQVQARVSAGFQGGDSDALTHGSSTMSTSRDGDEEETPFVCQLESFLQLAVNEIATKESMGWEGQTEANAAAVRLRCRRVVMAGALVPLALDDTLVIEHKVTLRKGGVSSASKKTVQANGKTPEGTLPGTLDIFGDTERLRDILHEHAYQGCLRVPVTDQFKVQRYTQTSVQEQHH